MAKTAQKTADLRIVESGAHHVGADGSTTLKNDEIARRAFELYCARGWQHGRDLDDWLQAERELRATGGARP